MDRFVCRVKHFQPDFLGGQIQRRTNGCNGDEKASHVIIEIQNHGQHG
jgi:hypothetical protein